MFDFLTPANVILGLKIAVGAVTLIFLASTISILLKKKKLHGLLNTIFFALTMTAVIAFEVIIRFILPDLTAQFSPEAKRALGIHLFFSIPSALLLPAMLWTGKKHHRLHVPLAVVFSTLWIGTVVTGIFFLPHD
ncbi:MAG: hypothetical protein N2112_01950 [Gemmataceae bacterium]|jgi:uncharacterized membrane protein|nr:hypothetical protein [Gemmataceae bacterium]